jgi:hypothetical protein
MDDFLKRRQEARQRAAAFWQSWQWEQPWQASGGCVALVNSGNYLLHHYFPGVFLQAVSDYVVDAGAKFQVAFSSGGRLEPMADAVLLAEAAPPGLPFGVQALLRRCRAAELPQRKAGFGKTQLSGSQFQVACAPGSDGLVHLRVFVNDNPAGTDADDRRLAVWLLLAQALGQWDLNVKTGYVELVEQPPRGALPLAELPAAFDQLWRAQLGHNGVYPSGEAEFRVYGSENDDGEPAKILVRNESAASLLGRADLAWCLSVRCEVYDDMSQALAQELAHEFSGCVGQHEQGILTAMLADAEKGEYTAFAMVAEPEGLWEKVREITARYERLDAQANCVFDPSWRHYRLQG